MKPHNTNITWLFICLSSIFFSVSCFAQDEVKNEKNAPTLARAKEVLAQEISDVGERYDRLREKFLKQWSFGTYNFDKQKWEMQKKFYRWEDFYTDSIILDNLKKEWNQHPESHRAIVPFLKDEIKKDVGKMGELAKQSQTIDDNEFFQRYCQISDEYITQEKVDISSLEKELNIPDELKILIKNQDFCSNLNFIYSDYTKSSGHKEFLKEIEQEKATQIATRKAIVPVSRDSKEYQEAFKAYKDAVAEREQIVSQAFASDPTYARATNWIENEQPGTGTYNNLKNKFIEKMSKEQEEKFFRWEKGIIFTVSNDAIEKEWKKYKESHIAILLVMKIMDAKKKREEDDVSIPDILAEIRKMSPQEQDTYFNKLQKENLALLQDIVSEVPQLEKDLNIPLQLKTTLIQQFTDSAPFIFYDTYIQSYHSEKIIDAEKKVSDCIDKLNNLRSNWAIEEKIEFPDKISWKMHQLGLDEKPQSKSWVRVACVVFGIVLIILFIVLCFRKKKENDL
jgi:hypothetical protein